MTPEELIQNIRDRQAEYLTAHEKVKVKREEERESRADLEKVGEAFAVARQALADYIGVVDIYQLGSL